MIIGVRLYTDIAMADGCELESILVLSGDACWDDLVGAEFQPDMVVASLRELVGNL